MGFVLLTALAVGFAGWILRLPPPEPVGARLMIASDGRPAGYETHVRPLLDRYCFQCHGERHKGGLDLRVFRSEDDVVASRKTFEHVLTHMEARTMPPEKKPQPTPDERALMVGWFRERLFWVDCEKPDPGRVTLRRLNRTEYNNTIRDLVGLDLKPADNFPADDVGYGFDNIGDVLSVPPMLLERYLLAAEKVLDAAVVTAPLAPPMQRFSGRDFEGGSDGGAGVRTLASNGDLIRKVTLDRTGEYRVRIRAFGDQAGDEPVRAALGLDGKRLQEVEIKAKRNSPGVYEWGGLVSAGEHRLTVSFLNDFYDPGNEKEKRRPRDRNFHLLGVEFVGPFTKDLPSLTASHKRIFYKEPRTTNLADQVSCAGEILGTFASRAFRRPVRDEELHRLTRIYAGARRDGDGYEQSVKLALEAVLVSPSFLFRLEAQPEPDNPKEVTPLDEYALASRLSYFLWSTMPDEELMKLAGQGQLRRRLGAQVSRMLADPRSMALVRNFASQWLQTRKLDQVAPDKDVFPDFDAALLDAMRAETEAFIGYIAKENRSVLELLDADYTFANARLARHYGLAGVQGEALQRVSLKGTRRGGLLTQASILTLTSNPTRTSPVKRGKWVLETILGTPPPAPPPNVPELQDGKGKKLTGTLRQRMEQHRVDPACAGCHALMDPVGFGFENFDGIGAWRDRDGDSAVDPSGKLVTGESFQGPSELKKILLTVKREDFVRSLATKLLTYALGRGLEYYDACTVDRVVQTLENGDYRFHSLVLGVVNSPAFQLRRGDLATRDSDR